jgi:hypothetical protein
MILPIPILRHYVTFTCYRVTRRYVFASGMGTNDFNNKTISMNRTKKARVRTVYPSNHIIASKSTKGKIK